MKTSLVLEICSHIILMGVHLQMIVSLALVLEICSQFPLSPKHAVQVEDMSGADAMAPLLRQEKTMFIQDRTSFRTPSFNLP